MEPPEIDRPFETDRMRIELLSDFLDACIALQAWVETARENRILSPEQRDALSEGLQLGDFPEARLARWASLFGDELEATLLIRNRIIHGLAVSDRDLRGASWLSRRLLGYLEPAEAA